MTEVDARAVLEEYMGTLRAGGSVVRDAAELPYPKDVIKAVLKGCLVRVDDYKTKETLKKAYIDLASFQVMTAAERDAVSAMSRVSDARSTDNEVLELARIVASYGDLHQVVTKRSLEEQEALFLEIRSA